MKLGRIERCDRDTLRVGGGLAAVLPGRAMDAIPHRWGW